MRSNSRPPLNSGERSLSEVSRDTVFRVIGRGRARLSLVALSALFTLTACGSPSPRSGASPSPTGTRGPGPTVSAKPLASQTPTRTCTNLAVIDSWPLARRAATLIVAPALNFDMTAVQMAAAKGVGGILLIGSGPPPPGLATQLRTAFAVSATAMAPLVMADEEGGGVQRLEGGVTAIPWARTMAKTMTPTQVHDLAATAGGQMLQLGVGVDLAPVLDVDGGAGPSATNADGQRSFSPDPSVVARYGVAFLQGLQAGGAMPVVKHFPGLGGASRNTDYGPATTLPIATLTSGGLQPFKAAIASGVPAVMMSNAAIPGVTNLPASLSPGAVNGLLRTTLGFQGLVLTDSLSAGAISQSGYDLPKAAVAAIAAGSDMVLFGSTITRAETALLTPANVAKTIGQIQDAIVTATVTGSMAVSRLNSAVDHILAARHTNLCVQ